MARVAIVTGGTRGIGEAISLALQEAGVTVAANYAGNDERARAFTERTGIPAFKWDVADHAACQQGCAQVAAELGPVDIVVNNAGITRDGTILKLTYEAWKEVIDTNLGGCFNMAKAVFPGMRERKWGRIVNIGSINGQAGQYGQVNYAAAKSGIHGFTKALAQEGARARRAISTPTWSPRCPATCWRRSSPRSRSAASARRARSRAAWRSCARTRPAS
jgi:acetoacetyl-CoA reductase